MRTLAGITIMRLYLVFILLLALGCNRPSGTNSVQDFSLVYHDNIDRIDFDVNTVTRKYIDSVRTIKVEIGKDNRKRILDFMLDNDVLSINDSRLSNNCDVHMLPESSFELEIMIDKEHAKRFNWTSNNCSDDIDILSQLTSLIKEQTMAQIPVGKLPPTNITAE
jgi:hypothetical protein